MDTKIDLFLNTIDNKIQSKHMLKHPFYQAWSMGQLSMPCLREYAKDYYHHVKAFPTYLSALHCRIEDMEIRKTLLQNLIEEEAGNPNHPELWKKFTLSLGIEEAELAGHEPSDEMKALISTFRSICQHHSLSEGLAALYAYESQIPEISVSKIEGLKKYYGLQNPEHYTYFSVHIEADREHAAQERALLKKCIKPDELSKIDSSVHQVLDRLWNFLSSFCLAFNMRC